MKHPIRLAKLLLLLPLLMSFGMSSASAADYKGPIIDMHMHTATHFKDDGSTPGFFSDPEEYYAEIYKRFEKYNVVKAMVSGMGMGDHGPIAMSWYKRDPDRVIPGMMFAAGSPTVDELRALHTAGKLKVMGEMGSYYLGLSANDPEVMPYFALAEELGIPVGYHLLPGGAPGTRYQDPNFAAIRAANANPMQFEEVMVAYPKLKVYMMHAGWPQLEDLKALMYAHPQLYVDISAINWIIPRAEFHAFLKGLIIAGHGKRIFFGSDPLNTPGVIDIGIEAVDSAPFLTNEQKADIFYYNAARFLELPKEEIAKHWASTKD